MAKRNRARTKAEIKADAQRTGRPRKKPSEKQSKRIMVYLTPDEYQRFEVQAKAEGVSLAALIMSPWRKEKS